MVPPPDRPAAQLREARDSDSAAIIDLIARVYAEYPNCFLDVDAEEPGLRTPASSFPGFWVVEAEAEVRGCITCGHGLDAPAADARFELKKLYLDPQLRGQGWGRRLIEHIEAVARERGFRVIELWSDSRFQTAHQVYLALGYRSSGRSRSLNDISDTVEYHFLKELAPA